MAEVDATDDAKTVKIDFSSMLQSKEAQKGIERDMAASKPTELGKAIPKQK